MPDEIRVGEIFELAYGRLESGDERLEELYERFRESRLVKAREAFTAGGLILTPLLAAVFDADADVSWMTFVAYVVAAVAAFLAGFIWLDRLRAVDRDYLDALRVYGLLRRAVRGP